MSQFPDFIARRVRSFGIIQPEDTSLDDTGISVEMGTVIIKCEDLERIDMEKLTPIEGFTRNDLYRHTMYEYVRWMGKACSLIADLYRQLLNAYDPKELEDFAERVEEFVDEV